MATCKDCIHCEACERMISDSNEMFNVLLSEILETNCDIKHGSTYTLSGAEFCQCFQDRSRFVELPCNVGERLYVLFPKGRAIVEYVVIAFWIEETGTIIRVVDTRFFTTTIFFIKDIGTKAFLTKKEAEQALKEREENG